MRRNKAKGTRTERTDRIAQPSKLVRGDAREGVCEALQGLWILDAACRQLHTPSPCGVGMSLGAECPGLPKYCQRKTENCP